MCRESPRTSCDLLNQPDLRARFAVGEYWNGDVTPVNDWVSSENWMRGRASAFDFPLYFKLLRDVERARPV